MTSAPRPADPAAPTAAEPFVDHPSVEHPSVEHPFAEHPVPVPQDQHGIEALRLEIDAVDAELVRLIKRRTAISNAIGTARKSLGGPRIVYSREMAILERFRELGPAGTDLGMMLLAMGRGRLGRK